MKNTVQDRPPNFRNTEGKLYLVRCFICEPKRGLENNLTQVAAGICFQCGFSEESQPEQYEKVPDIN